MRRVIKLTWFIVAGMLILSSCGQDPTPQVSGPITTDKGTPQGDAASKTIGVTGGSVQSADGKLELTIPSGALSANTLVSIQSISNEGPLGIGKGYRLSPEGTTFAQPVTLTFNYDDQLLNGANEDFLWIITQAADGSWNALLKSELDPDAKTVSVTTSHFSDWALGKFIELSLQPSASTVLVNESVQLTVFGFAPAGDAQEEDELAPLVAIEDDGMDYLAPLVPIRATESKLLEFHVKGWTMNGATAPVSNSNGSLNASNLTATYKAPNKKPSTNPVAVSMQLEARDFNGAVKSSYLLTSSISVVESNLFLVLNVDGQSYEYYEYGPNGTAPPDPNNFQIVNCGRDGNKLMIAASYVAGDNISNSFALLVENPGEGTQTLGCGYDDSADELAFSLVPGGGYTNGLIKRTKVKDTCDDEYICSDVSITFIAYSSRDKENDVRGFFSGMVYEEKDEFEKECRSSEAHTISGEFWLKRLN